MFRKLTPKFTFFLTFALLIALAGTAIVQAAVFTDKPDYLPGSTVTISGDNSDNAGYLPGEIVQVAVSGPNGYTSACEGTADASGAWSCQVVLWANENAIGDYTYTATGVQSKVSQGGTFQDGKATIYGTVKNQSGTLLANATVTCSAGCNLQSSTTTDANGAYSFDVNFSQSPTVTFTASFEGYSPATNVITISNKDKIQIDFSLSNLKRNQTITFDTLTDKTFNDAAFALNASASSGLPVSFTAAGNCTVSGNTVTLTGAGRCTITASQAGNGSYNPAPDIQQTFSIAKANQTITFGPLSDKIFGDADFDVSANNSSGQLMSFSASGSCTINGVKVHITGAGRCTITASAGESQNYNAATPVSQPFTIAKANQTITFGALDGKTYGDTTFGVGASATSGLPVAFSATGNCSISGATVTITGTGSCTITASQVGNDNFNAASEIQQSFNIAKAPITVTADNANRIYGEVNPAFTGSISGIKNNDAITATYSTVATAASSVGTYAITPTVVGTPATLSNYDVTLANGTLSITARPITVTADNKTKVYGENDPGLTYQVTIGSQVNGDVFTGELTRDGGKNVGGYAITQGTLSLGDNYAMEFIPGTLTITKATLTVSAANASRDYGDPNPTFTVSYAGFKNGEAMATSGVSGDPSLTTSAVAISPVGQYVITVGQGTLAAFNYDFTLVNGTLTINKAHLAVTADSYSRTYGDPNPAFDGAIVGIKNGEDITATYATTADAKSPVGTYSITPTVVDGDPATLSNYDVNLADGTLTITKATLTVTADNKSRIYGEANPTFTATYTGFKNDETLATSGVTGDPTMTTTANVKSPVGAYDITTAKGTLAAVNYDFTFANGELTIKKALLTITAKDANRIYGDTNPSFTGAIVGIKNGDAITDTYITEATAASPVGAYAIVPAAIDSTPSTLGNYTVNLVNGTLTIAKAILTVKADDIKVFIVSSPIPTFTATITGFKNGETLATSGVTGTPAFTTTYTPNSPVGSYPITVSKGTLDAVNYDFTFVDGTLIVTYDFPGFLQPINDTAHERACGTNCTMSVFKAGSTIPVKFQILDYNGKPVQAYKSPVWMKYFQGGKISLGVDESTIPVQPDSGSTFRWDATSQQYIYNWSTKGLQSGNWYGIGVTLDDGQQYVVIIGLK